MVQASVNRYETRGYYIELNLFLRKPALSSYYIIIQLVESKRIQTRPIIVPRSYMGQGSQNQIGMVSFLTVDRFGRQIYIADSTTIL